MKNKTIQSNKLKHVRYELRDEGVYAKAYLDGNPVSFWAIRFDVMMVMNGQPVIIKKENFDFNKFIEEQN